MKTIRIACGQGFWGDWLEAPVRLIEGGPVDYLVLDYLAEVTMSIMQKQKSRNPKAGFATDFVALMDRILPQVLAKNVRVIANAGGVNPQACAEAVRMVAARHGLADQLRIGIVAGDDILGRLDELMAAGHTFENLDTGEPLATVRAHLQSANVYFGAQPIAEALRQGAQVIITGRCTDTGLALAPCIHEFGWAADDWHRLAAGTVAGHIIECGAQCTGGNCLVDWETTPDYANIGFPIIEMHEDGTFVVTKHPNTGGRVTVATVKEQLVYEMGDPTTYITPDCIADFTTIQLAQEDTDRVRVWGIQGRPATEFYKVSASYFAGYKAVGSLIYAWPDAYAKARRADAMLRQRLHDLGLHFDEIWTEYVGAGACHGLQLAGEPSRDLPEVVLRVAVRSSDQASVERFTKELAPLALNGPPTVTGFGSGRPKVEEVVAYFPTLIPKAVVTPDVQLLANG
ncbi:DUF1446 domain-containing protein [Chloracidobacterium sp. D]|jgi:hypothetical protein|uniref:acyclic terpene utilization AtuA family protein n=1 Tax=Chloracidobacterium sp. D TaxID=2821536 RepID=UPI001B8BE65C|nr:acyclic terpene utilization AtuA family protein [Chloracidobacterium sp. D]QUV83502.1 DUF1446 domain-containing protein [Chloracidobacterium sp. D]